MSKSLNYSHLNKINMNISYIYLCWIILEFQRLSSSRLEKYLNSQIVTNITHRNSDKLLLAAGSLLEKRVGIRRFETPAGK